MSPPSRYPICTLAQMSAIPEDVQSRFLAELPLILRTMRQIEAAIPTLAAQAKAKAPWPLNLLPISLFEAGFRGSLNSKNAMTWVDDDNGLATVNVRWRDGGEAFFTQTEKMDGGPRA